MRGLKLIALIPSHRSVVAPYTGAWIETELIMAGVAAVSVAPYTGAWIETKVSNCVMLDSRRTLYGCVD